MFKQTVICSTSLLGAVIGAWLFLTLHVSEREKNHFKALQEKGRTIIQAAQTPSTQQNRLGVRKDMWIAQADGKRLHHRIESRTSVLNLIPVGDRLEFVENLEQIQCAMQDRMMDQNGNPFQQIRYFDAASGVYYYSTNRFTAQTVSLTLLRLPGTDLPLSLSQASPYLKGVAQEVSFAFAGKASQFRATQFKATFQGQQEEAP